MYIRNRLRKKQKIFVFWKKSIDIFKKFFKLEDCNFYLLLA